MFCSSVSFSFHSTPPACGQSTWPTADQIPTTLQRTREHWTHLICSSDVSKATFSHSVIFFLKDDFSLSHSTFVLATSVNCFTSLVNGNGNGKTTCSVAGWLRKNLRASHDSGVQILFLQFPQSLTDVYCCKNYQCWEFICNSNVMEPGLTLQLLLCFFKFLFRLMHHDMYIVKSNKAMQCWGLWKCS